MRRSQGKLRNKLYFAFFPLVVLLISMGLYAIFLTVYLTQNLDRLYSESGENIQTIGDIVEAVHRIDAASALIRRGYPETGRRMLAEHRAELTESLMKKQALTRTEDEARLSRELQEAVDRFIRLATMVEDRGRLLPSDYAIMKEESVQRVNALASELIELKNTQLKAAYGDVRYRATTFVIVTIISIVVSLVLALIISYQTGRWLVQPLEEFTEKAQEIAGGNFDTMVTHRSRDEIGGLATAFNQMISELRHYRQILNHQITQTRMTLEWIVRNLPQPFFFFDVEGELTIANESAEQLMASPEWRGEIPEELEAIRERVMKTHKPYAPHRLEDALIFHVRNEERFFLPKVFFIEPEEAETGVALLLEDVTRLRLSDDVKTDLVAIVSHELKTPLTSARLSLYMLEEEQFGELNEAQCELIRTAREDLDRQLRTIQNLLDLSRIESGKSRMEFHRIAVEDVVTSAIAQTSLAAQERSIRIERFNAENLPTIEADETRIGLALTNLLSNAIKYSPEGSTVRVRTTLSSDKDHVEISVIDDGPGIPQQYLSLIFNKFYRMSKGGQSGAGLGLSIAREIALAHGGDVGCESEEGKGSRFFLLLPIERDPARRTVETEKRA